MAPAPPVPPTTRVTASAPTLRQLGVADYVSTWRAMQTLTAQRDAATRDEIWLLQHPPVYTQGLAGKPEHLLRADTGIPVVKIDRGGQITYHGPGQLVAYLLLDMKRRGLGVRPLVRKMEAAVINLLGSYGITANYRADAPGVYVNESKIAALGLRVKNGCCYHGLALNIALGHPLNIALSLALALAHGLALGPHPQFERGRRLEGEDSVQGEVKNANLSTRALINSHTKCRDMTVRPNNINRSGTDTLPVCNKLNSNV